MKKILLLHLFLIVSLSIYAQETPTIQLNDSTQLKLSILKVDVQIIGNFATTTYDMKFYNELDRTLEGELAFPLGEGQSVSGFAMDVNGKMRDAVIVEKELARVAFESTVRQNIDPGLLEKTQGNNYKARVYPILPKEYKRIQVTYEHELNTVNNSYVYELPLGFKERLDKFSIDVKIYGKNAPVALDNVLFFDQEKDLYHAVLNKENYLPATSMVINIPVKLDSQQIMTSGNFFYIHQKLEPNSRIKRKPKKVTVLWDNSFSLAYKKTKKELNLLNLYFTYLQNVEVQFISFNNSINTSKIFTVTNGIWSDIKREIESIQYDGGTSFGCLDTVTFLSDEILFFTDGLRNLGDYNSLGKKTIYVINSSGSGDHELMNTMATSSGGSYINLKRYGAQDAFKILKHETYQFLGIKKNKDVVEIYPRTNTNVRTDFSVSGKFLKKTTIKLLFGYQNKVEKEIEIMVEGSIANEKIVKRLWAKQKLKFLNNKKEENKPLIISLAKQYHLITDYTSMLILDRIEDYVKYRIEPPQELRAEYKERIVNIEEEEQDKKEELEERKEELFEDYEDIMKWYTTVYPKKKPKQKKKEEIEGDLPEENENTSTNSNLVQQDTVQNTDIVAPVSNSNRNVVVDYDISVRANIAVVDTVKRVVSGVITDGEGLSLPGVSIVVNGTEKGTQTDFDGKFTIHTEIGKELRFLYVGFKPKTLIVEDLDAVNIILEEDVAMLDEVVVTAQAVTTQKRTLGYSVSEVNLESLSGAVAGVNVKEQSRGESPSVTLRGISTISDTEPLYVVDGTAVGGNPISQLSPDDIVSVQALKEASSVTLYGSRGANGVVIITTKEGEKSNKKAITELNQKITDKIELKPWSPDVPYIKILEKEKTIDLAYAKYLEIRNQYANIPSFYLDVADFFDHKGASDIAIRVVTNLIEVDIDNHELMRALGYKLEYFGQYKLAVSIYQKVLELRPEEPQSYRDLALAYEYIGEFQKSFDLLYKIYNAELLEKDEDERFYGIEGIAYIELNRLVYKHSKKLKLNESQRSKFTETPMDVRVVIDWNHNDTDIDLWVIDPNNEKGYYSNSRTNIGGRLSEDMTEGYGPEEFTLKNAVKGNYQIMVDYFADSVQKISGPTVLKVSMFANYGKKNESRKITIIRLDNKKDEIEVGNLKF